MLRRGDRERRCDPAPRRLRHRAGQSRRLRAAAGARSGGGDPVARDTARGVPRRRDRCADARGHGIAQAPAAAAGCRLDAAPLTRLIFIVALLATQATAAPAKLAASADALAAAMRGTPVVVLGEVHDNVAQHALRAAALRRLVERGARPAIAFEQFDRDAQDAIDRARRERPGDLDYLIAQGKGASGWQWQLYKPYLALANQYGLPIVAANLARADAMKIAMGDASRPKDVSDAVWRMQQEAIAEGHCRLLPDDALPGMARAQIERDRTLAASIAPYAQRGVVLLTGNEHARKDIGVPHWLHAHSKSIGLLE